MTKPDDIPQDVWDIALRVWAEMRTVDHDRDPEWGLGDVDEIASAILAERERCAGEADNLHALEFANSPYREGYYTALDTVAAAIRKGAQQMTSPDLTQWARSLFSNISNSNVPVTDEGEAKLIRSSRTGSEEPTPSSKFPASDKTGKRGWATNTAIAADQTTGRAPGDNEALPVVTGGKSIPHGGYVK